MRDGPMAARPQGLRVGGGGGTCRGWAAGASMAAGRERLGELLTMRLAVKHVGPRLAANCKTRAGARGTAKGKHPYGNNQKLSAQCISNIWISILLRKGHGGGDSPCNTCVRTAPGTQDRMRRCGDAHLPAQRERERDIQNHGCGDERRALTSPNSAGAYVCLLAT